MEVNITPEMEAQFEPIMAKYSYLANPLNKANFEHGLRRLYADAGEKLQEVVYCADPRKTIDAAINAYFDHEKGKGSKITYDEAKKLIEEEGVFYTTWTRGRAAFAEVAEIVGINIEDKAAVETMLAMSTHAALIVPFDTVCFVSENAIEHHMRDRVLHNENGPSWGWGPGLLNLYNIEGHFFPEHVILDPKSQTLEEINAESNEEKRRIRISRYGWERFLIESGAKQLDTKIIKLASGVSWMESLMRLEGDRNRDGYTVLCTYDPSTKRPYAMTVPQEITKCEDAQRFFVGYEEAFAGFPVKPVQKAYPVMRT